MDGQTVSVLRCQPEGNRLAPPMPKSLPVLSTIIGSLLDSAGCVEELIEQFLRKAADPGDIMTEGFEEREQSGISTLVKEKFHTCGWCVPVRFSSTARWAYWRQALTSSSVSSG